MTSTEALTQQPTDLQRAAVAIVIPVHNKSTITRQCLDALLAEPDEGLARDIVVVDDGSTDATPDVLSGYAGSIQVIRHDSALGFAGACNAGVAATAGEFFVLLNNDTIPRPGWLAALVNHAVTHPAAAVVGAKLLFPNDTIQHAGVVFGLDSLPHHLYAGFPADHPATSVSRRFQVVTAACALFRRRRWEELGGLSTDYRNGWEDVDYCMRVAETGHEVHYCAESVLYHFESASRDVLSAVERENQSLFATRWRDKIIPDDLGYYWVDGLLSASYGARYPIQFSVSPFLAGVNSGENDRLADKLLYDRARQVMILLRNNIILNVRVQEAEARAAVSERRLAEILAQQQAGTEHYPPAVNAPSPPSLPHKIVGTVESPGSWVEVVTDGVLVVSGWTLTESGGAIIEAIVDGAPRGSIAYGEPRPDVGVLYPGYPAGDNCGFSGDIDVSDLPDGVHEFTVRISTPEGGRAQLDTTFEVDNHAFERGRVIGRLDLPVRGTPYLPRKSASLTGWALAPSGIRSLAVLLDGKPTGQISYGALRPDIAKRRRQYPDADHCGFYGSFPLIGLDEGRHDLVIAVTAADGGTLELATQIEIEGGDFVDAGLPSINRQYETWLEQRSASASGALAETPESPATPLLQIIVPLGASHEDELDALAASLLAQTSPAWQMTLVSSGQTRAATTAAARARAATDKRIDFDETTECLDDALARGDAPWVAILRPGVVLAPTAVATIDRFLAAEPETRLLYTDDDRLDPESARRWNPFFKPDWSPDLLLSMSYLGPLVVFGRQAIRSAGGLRPGFAGAEEYDLALRVTDEPIGVRHIPEVLASTVERAPAPEAPWHLADWREGDRRALEDTIVRRGLRAAVEKGLHPGTWRVRYALPEPPEVTAIIPTGGKLELLRPCLEDLLEQTDYPRLDVLVVDNSQDDAVERLVIELSRKHANLRRVAEPRKPFNFSALVNAGARHAESPYLLMLNDDISVIDPDWLTAMIEHVQRPGVGVVGAKLLYPDDTIQHAGVVLGPFRGSVHAYKRLPGDDPGAFDLPNVIRNFSAVTFACAVIDRALFDRLGGLDETNLPVAFNDTDYCLRVREAGYDVVYTPFARLYHHESVTKTVIAHPHEIAFLRQRWADVIAHDPFYNPNLTRKAEDGRLNMDPVHVA
jgi:GT2 family glycosyltransferase